MTLRLSVVSEHGIRLGAHSTKVFGVHGGGIGRGTDNEWILPDPERYLSGKHARVEFRGGSYVLVDISSNGTYVNGAQEPLGKDNDYTLKDGDYVRLGEYELLVSIDQSNDFPPEQGAVVAYDGRTGSSAVRKATANDLGASLDVSELLAPSGSGREAARPRNSYGQSIVPESAEPPVLDDAVMGPSPGPATPWHMMTRPLKMPPRSTGAPSAAQPSAGPPARAQQTAHVFDGDLEVGLSAFCRGAGIDSRNISAEARAAALQVAGQLLRECVLGIMDLTQNRNEWRNRFRITAPADDGRESPLNFSRGVDDALVRLLATVSTRASSVDAVRESFRALKSQHSASLTAMHAAFEAFLERVDPKELAERFDRTAKRGVFSGQNKGKYWDQYAEMFPGLSQRPPDGFPHLFTEAFAKAYAAKLRTLMPPRRSTFGADREDPEADGKAVGDL